MSQDKFRRMKNAAFKPQTQSGKTIYDGAEASDPRYSEYTAQDHRDAAEFHSYEKENWSKNPEPKVKAFYDERRAKSQRRVDEHLQRAKDLEKLF